MALGFTLNVVLPKFLIYVVILQFYKTKQFVVFRNIQVISMQFAFFLGFLFCVYSNFCTVFLPPSAPMWLSSPYDTVMCNKNNKLCFWFLGKVASRTINIISMQKLYSDKNPFTCHLRRIFLFKKDFTENQCWPYICCMLIVQLNDMWFLPLPQNDV